MKTLVLLVSVLTLSQMAFADDARNYRCVDSDASGAQLVVTMSATGADKNAQLNVIFWDQKSKAQLTFYADGAQVPAEIFPAGAKPADYDVMMGPGTAIDGSALEKVALVVSKTIVDGTASSGQIIVMMGEEGKMTTFACSEGN